MREPKRDSTLSFYRALGLPSLLLLTLLFLVPLSLILTKAVITPSGPSFDKIRELLSDRYTYRILRFSLLQAFISSVVSIVVALPGAYLLATYRFRGKRFIQAVATIPFVLPSILVVLGFVIFYGNSGFVNRALMALFSLDEPPLKILYSFKTIILAHTFYNAPIALALISSFWEQMDDRVEQAALTLGATKKRVFRTITLPRLTPAIMSAFTLIFLFCFSSFAILLVLGGGPQFTNLEVEIYRRARLTLDLEGAATLSLLSIGCALILVAIYLWFQKKMAIEEKKRLSYSKRVFRKAHSVKTKVVIFLYLFGALLLLLGPLGAIIYNSFSVLTSRGGSSQLSLRWYKELFLHQGSLLSVGLQALLTSLGIATVSAFVALLLGTGLAGRLTRSSKGVSMELYAMLPMAVSSVVVGVGYYLVSRYIYYSYPLRVVVVILAHVVIASPFVLRSLLPAYRNISHIYREASLTLGANVRQTFFRIEIPLLRAAMATAFAFAFALSIGEINATMILSDSHLITIPIVMYRLIGSYNYSAACALGTLLIVMSTLLFVLAEYSKRGRYE